jgi:arsenical pump membrane protein
MTRRIVGSLRSVAALLRDTIASRHDPPGLLMWGGALLLVPVSAVLRSRALRPAFTSTAIPFLTLGGVLVAGAVLDRLGVFRWVVQTVVPRDAGWRATFASVLALTAVLGGLVNLDVAVVVAMPVALRSARRAGGDPTSLAVAVAATANASSILLPTSNLTNLLVLGGSPGGPAAYLRASWAAWLAVLSVTIAALTLILARKGPTDMRVAETPGLRLGALADLA